MKKCAIFFTLFVMLLIIASMTEKAQATGEANVNSKKEVPHGEPLVTSSKIKPLTAQE